MTVFIGKYQVRLNWLFINYFDYKMVLQTCYKLHDNFYTSDVNTNTIHAGRQKQCQCLYVFQ